MFSGLPSISRFAVGDAGSFLDALRKGGLTGAAIGSGLGGGTLGAAGLYEPGKGFFGTDSGPANFIKRGGVAGLTGHNPMEGFLFNDSAPAKFFKGGGVAGLTGYDPMQGVVGDSNPFGSFGGGLGAIGGLFGKGGKSRGLSGLGGFRPAGLIASLFGG